MDRDAGISPYLRWVHDHGAGAEYRLIDRRINDHGLFFVREGVAAISIAGERRISPPGTIALVRPHLLHSVVSESPTPLRMLNIHFDLTERPGCAAIAFHQDPRAPRKLDPVDVVPVDQRDEGWMPTFAAVDRILYEQLFRRVLMLYPLRDERVGRLEIKAAMLDLLAYVRRLDLDDDAIPDGTIETARRAAECIQARFGEPLAIADIARAAGAARSTLMRAFRTAYGTTPMAYLRGVRIAKAKQELLLGQRPPKAIARTVGFDSVHHFTRVFHAETGLPPAAFRKRFMR